MTPLPDEAEAEETEPTRFAVVSMAVAIEGGLVLLAVILGWLFEHHPLTHFTLDLAGLGWGLVAAVPMLLGFLVMNRWPIGPLTPSRSSRKRPFVLS